ncbi:unnamed protein product [Adineta ricciae]|uniref:Ornithine decarboxylase antizyme n=1 Tax=Adineta ricciae TaxID=249248 RepID=A0A813VCN5_ADIRI|nr:unnamed protein product [Adineta ricciae]CAF0872606.1 unnamed protein product [Adineta ricciae]
MFMLMIDISLAAVVLTSNISAEGGSVGRRVLASRHSVSTANSIESNETSACRIDVGEDSPAKKKEILQFTDEHNLLWPIKLRADCLYVALPQQLGEGSKEKFVSLLEFADDILKCKNLIVYFDKTRSDRASLVKTFMFLGFHPLAPNNPLTSSIDSRSNQLFLIYSIDGDG